MKRIITSTLIMGLAGISSATIINIPADYPTIQQGIDASADGDTVLVQPGTYVENINFNGHNIVLGSLFLTTGDSSYIEQTVIDGDSAGSTVIFENGETSTAFLTGFTIYNGFGIGGLPFYYGGGITCKNQSNPTIYKNIIRENTGTVGGGGINCYRSSPIIANNIIRENTSADGGGISCYSQASTLIINNIINNNIAEYGAGLCFAGVSPSILINNVISENDSAWLGGGIYCSTTNLEIYNCIIDDNSSGFGGAIYCRDGWDVIINNSIIFGNYARLDGGGINCIEYTDAILNNSILWSNTADRRGDEIHLDEFGSALVSYSNIQDTLWAGIGNISIDPLFSNTANNNFHLMSTACGDSVDSPCIDAGDPTIQDIVLDCDWGLGSNISDMGAYGGGDSLMLAVNDYVPPLPEKILLLQNYPNPFNASTIIKFALPEESYVELDVYNLLGQKMETVFKGLGSPGFHSVAWDGSDFPSGIYFARLHAGSISKSVKMLLLK